MFPFSHVDIDSYEAGHKAYNIWSKQEVIYG